MNPEQALLWNAGTCRSNVKGEAQVGNPCKGKSTDVEHRDGAVRSREEGPVMGLDRRDCGNSPRTVGQPVNGRSQMTKAKPLAASICQQPDTGSRMNREVHVRF